MHERRQPDDEYDDHAEERLVAYIEDKIADRVSIYKVIDSDENWHYLLRGEQGGQFFLSEKEAVWLSRCIMAELYPRDLEPLVGSGTEILSAILTQLGNLTSSLVSLYRHGSTDEDVIYRQAAVVCNAINSLVNQTLAMAPIGRQSDE
jgi:hypothetical protein